MNAHTNKLAWVYLRPCRDCEAEAEFVRFKGHKSTRRTYHLTTREYDRIVGAGGEVNLETGSGFEVCITPAARIRETRERVNRELAAKYPETFGHLVQA